MEIENFDFAVTFAEHRYFTQYLNDTFAYFISISVSQISDLGLSLYFMKSRKM